MTNLGKLVLGLAAIVAVAVLFLWRYAVFNTWSEVFLLHDGLLVMMGAVTVLAFAIVWVFYQMTISRTLRYAKELRSAGYAVEFDHELIWEFACYLLMGVVMSTFAIWLTHVTWGNYWRYGQWDLIWFIVVGLIWLIGIAGLLVAIGFWVTSFKPIKKYYRDLQNGKQLDLPRIGS